MGMFDHINFIMDCPECGSELNNFQSKDSYCTLEIIDPDTVDTFYCYCDNCNERTKLRRNERIERKKPRDKPFTLDEVLGLGFNVVKEL